MSGLNTAAALIFGGCCSNVFTLEAIVKHQPNTGLLITVVQFALTALFALPSQLQRSPRNATTTTTSSSSSTGRPSTALRISTPKIPLPRLALLALLFFTVNMLNNWAFAFNISVPMHIILRSFGSVQTMAVGWMVGKRYTRVQVGSVLALTIGVIVAAWADAVGKGKLDTKPSPSETTTNANSTTAAASAATSSYTTGLLLLFTAQLISAYMGILTEQTYTAHGRHWGETLFYSHFLGLLFSLAFLPTLLTQWHSLTSTSPQITTSSTRLHSPPFSYLPRSVSAYTPTHPLTLLALNALTQIACISGVNQLSASTTAVTVTVVLNIRKLVSFLLSCAIFGNEIDGLMGVGAGLVFVSGAVYGWDSARRGRKVDVGRVVGERAGDDREGLAASETIEAKGSAVGRDGEDGVVRRRGADK